MAIRVRPHHLKASWRSWQHCRLSHASSAVEIDADVVIQSTRRSQLFIPTMHETTTEAAIPSHQLLLRAGYMRKAANGTFVLLPLALRVMEKLEHVIDKEMSKIGCGKVGMPSLLSADQWKQSGRWESTGRELFRLKDRKGDDYCLGPTHEEIFTSLVAAEVSSYRQLPVKLYQIGQKYRDEIRPRFGLLRAREFVMKDLYTFDLSADDAMKTYYSVVDAYRAVLDTLEVEYAQVEADSGNIGGDLSHEFQILSDVGEDEILGCKACGYAANTERAVSLGGQDFASSEVHEASIMEEFNGDQVRPQSVKDKLEKYNYVLLTRNEQRTQELLIEDLVLVCTEKPSRPNLMKVKPFLNLDEYSVRSEEDTIKLLKDSATKCKIFLDDRVSLHKNKSCEHEKELEEHSVVVGDFRMAEESDVCKCGQGRLMKQRGIEVGHVFYLGTKYASLLDARYINQEGKKVDIEMGCYGLGVSRIIAAVIESLYDSKGIRWPAKIAPYKAVVVSAHGGKRSQSRNTVLQQQAIAIANALNDERHLTGEIVIDDRWELGIGQKLTEAELVGYPWIVVLGNSFIESGLVEVQKRNTGEKHFLTPTDLAAMLK